MNDTPDWRLADLRIVDALRRDPPDSPEHRTGVMSHAADIIEELRALLDSQAHAAKKLANLTKALLEHAEQECGAAEARAKGLEAALIGLARYSSGTQAFCWCGPMGDPDWHSKACKQAWAATAAPKGDKP